MEFETNPTAQPTMVMTLDRWRCPARRDAGWRASLMSSWLGKGEEDCFNNGSQAMTWVCSMLEECLTQVLIIGLQLSVIVAFNSDVYIRCFPSSTYQIKWPINLNLCRTECQSRVDSSEMQEEQAKNKTLDRPRARRCCKHVPGSRLCLSNYTRRFTQERCSSSLVDSKCQYRQNMCHPRKTHKQVQKPKRLRSAHNSHEPCPRLLL